MPSDRRNNNQLRVRLSDDLHETVTALAAEYGVTKQQIIDASLRLFVQAVESGAATESFELVIQPGSLEVNRA